MGSIAQSELGFVCYFDKEISPNVFQPEPRSLGDEAIVMVVMLSGNKYWVRAGCQAQTQADSQVLPHFIFTEAVLYSCPYFQSQVLG